MRTLSAKDLAKKLCKRSGLSETQSQEAIEIIFDEIYQGIKKGNSVSLRNIGKFYVKPTPSSWIFKFSPSQKWRKMLGWSSSYKGTP